jgi:outer membrane protein OmpA-like peptidoglycan-associated protein
MNKTIIYLIIVLFPIFLFSQKKGQELIDSLSIELSNVQGDTNKINLLYELSESYRIFSPEKGVSYANQGIELAKKINWKEGIAKHYDALFKNYWAAGEFDLAVDAYNKLTDIEKELGSYKAPEATAKLKTIDRTFTYPTSEHTSLTREIRNYLDDVIVYMKQNPNVVIAITGHSDNFGTFEQNDSRAKTRAQVIVNYLTSRGISQRRLLASGKGSIEPVASNNTEEGRRKNRRVVIKMVGSLK